MNRIRCFLSALLALTTSMVAVAAPYHEQGSLPDLYEFQAQDEPFFLPQSAYITLDLGNPEHRNKVLVSGPFAPCVGFFLTDGTRVFATHVYGGNSIFSERGDGDGEESLAKLVAKFVDKAVAEGKQDGLTAALFTRIVPKAEWKELIKESNKDVFYKTQATFVEKIQKVLEKTLGGIPYSYTVSELGDSDGTDSYYVALRLRDMTEQNPLPLQRFKEWNINFYGHPVITGKVLVKTLLSLQKKHTVSVEECGKESGFRKTEDNLAVGKQSVETALGQPFQEAFPLMDFEFFHRFALIIFSDMDDFVTVLEDRPEEWEEKIRNHAVPNIIASLNMAKSFSMQIYERVAAKMDGFVQFLRALPRTSRPLFEAQYPWEEATAYMKEAVNYRELQGLANEYGAYWQSARPDRKHPLTRFDLETRKFQFPSRQQRAG